MAVADRSARRGLSAGLARRHRRAPLLPGRRRVRPPGAAGPDLRRRHPRPATSRARSRSASTACASAGSRSAVRCAAATRRRSPGRRRRCAARARAAEGGLRQVVATIVKTDGVKAEGLGPDADSDLEPRCDVRRSRSFISSLLIGGPYNGRVPEDSPSRRRIFTCRPASRAEETACATKILSTLARRAYRRPAPTDDVQTLLGFFERARADGSFDDGIRAALERLLVSPDFLFRIEADPGRSPPGAAYRLSDVELASRLSFFLWSSIPDDELLDVAVRDSCGSPACSTAGAAHAGRSARPRRAGGQLLRPVAADPQRVAADAGRQHASSRGSTTTCAPRSSAKPSCSWTTAEGRPQHRRSADGRLHVPQRAAGRATTGFAASTAATSGA